MQAQAMVDTDSTRHWRDLLEGRLICPAALFHTTSHEHTLLDMIQEFPLMAAGHHLPASIFGAAASSITITAKRSVLVWGKKAKS